MLDETAVLENLKQLNGAVDSLICNQMGNLHMALSHSNDIAMNTSIKAALKFFGDLRIVIAKVNLKNFPQDRPMLEKLFGKDFDTKEN